MRIEDFKKIPMVDAISIPIIGGEYNLIKNSWWCISEDDCLLYYRGYSRQCNRDKTIAEHIMSIENHPAIRVEFLENVWEKHNCSDYD